MEDKQSTVEKFRSACNNGDFEAVLQLLGSGECSPTLKVRRGYSCLHYAAAHGKLDVVRTLIETYRCNPKSKGRGGYTSLHFACYYGHIDVVKYLVSKRKCSPYRENQDGFLPLHYALNAHLCDAHSILDSESVQDARHFEIVKFLVLECLRRPGKLKALSHTILHMACKYGALEDIQCFIEKLQVCIAKDCDPKTHNTLVHVACENGRLEVVKYLIEKEHCDPRNCNSDGDNAVHIACRNGKFEVLKYLLEEEKLDPTVSNAAGNTLLHLACMNEHLESATVEYLIERGCKTNVENRNGELPLYLACQNQSLDIIKLVSAFTQPPEKKVRKTPVHIACSDGNLETVKHLVKERCWNPQCEDSDGLTPLHHACGYQRYGYHYSREVNLELVLFLIKECGCNPMKTIDTPYHSDEHAYGPIALACKECDLELMKALTSSDVNCRDKYGSSPLHLACKYEAVKILRYLIEEAKCDPTIQNSKGELPLHVACEQKSLEMVKLASGCNIDSRTTDGDTPLHIACKLGTFDVVRYLIQVKGCSPPQHREIYHTLCIHLACKSEDMTLIKSIATPENVNNYCTSTVCHSLLDTVYEGFCTGTPLHTACKNGKLELVQFLVREMNASVNVVDADEKLPLHFACSHKSLEMVQLVSGCEDVNGKDSQGDTPLHIACKNETLKTVRFLIREKLCDPTLQNKQGQLCLHIACQKQSLEMAKLVSDCDPNCTMNCGDTPLHITCRHGNLSIAKYLIIERKCDLTVRNSNGELPFHYACMHSLEMVRLIVDVCQQSVVSTTTNEGTTPLHFACLCGKLEIVTFLTEEKAVNPSAHDKNGLTPLHYACHFYGYRYMYMYPRVDNEIVAAIAKYLVTRHECNPLESKNTAHQYSEYHNSNYSPLEKAVVEGNLELVTALTSGNLNVDYLSSSGESMLHVACAHRQLEIVEFLVTGRYCNQVVQNHTGQTALHIACKIGCLETVKLVSSNCDVNTQTVDGGDTPLHIACLYGHNIAIAKFLIEVRRSNSSIPNSQGDMALHIACKRNSLALVTSVSNCDVNARSRGDTPLHITLNTYYGKEKEQIVNYLVNDKHCDLSLPDEHGWLPLHIACQCSSLAIVKLCSNCDVNAKSQDEDTPLHIALKKMREKHVDVEGHQIVDYLVNEKRCDVSLPDKDGQLPLHIACQYDSLALVKLVSNYNVNATTKNGDTPLHIVIQQIKQHCQENYKAIQVVEYLVNEKHCDLSVPDECGNLPLHIACQHNSLALVKLVSNCSVNTANKNGNTPLHIALKEAGYKFFGYLVSEKHCDLTLPDENGCIPLHIACQKGLPVWCLNDRTKDEDTPLHTARVTFMARIVMEPFIKVLVEANASSVNICDKDGNTPLHYVCGALQSQHTIGFQSSLLPSICSDYKLFTLVECLVGDNTECDVSITNNKNESALHLACAAPTMPLKGIKLLLTDSRNKSYLCNAKDNFGDTPLHIACRRTSPIFADYLVKSQLCSTNVQNNEEELPLHIACRNSESFNSVIKMLSWQCKLNCTNKTGDTPLHILCKKGNFEAIQEVLCIPHCDTDIQNHDGEVPLHLACKFDQKIVELVGAHCHHSPNIQTTSGDTLLHVACQNGNLDVVKYLTENMHCDTSIQNKRGLLPLHYASCHQPVAMAKLVKTCDPNLQCNAEYEFKYQRAGKSTGTYTCRIEAGDTPLHVACRHGYFKVISFLVKEMKCDVNIPNSNGEMPLHIVFQSHLSSLNVMKVMRRCNPNAQTKCGDTPLHVAVRHASTSIVQHLVNNMKCNINIPNKSREQPLHILLHHCCKEDAIPLITNSLNVNSKDEHGNTPLHIACLKFSRKL